MVHDAREYIKQGNYKAAEKLLRAEISERSNHVGHTLGPTRDLAECLEKADRHSEIRAVLGDRLRYYLGELATVCESIEEVEEMFEERGGKKDGVVSEFMTKERHASMVQVMQVMKRLMKEEVEKVDDSSKRDNGVEKNSSVEQSSEKNSAEKRAEKVKIEDSQKIVLVEPENVASPPKSSKKKKKKKKKKRTLHRLPGELIQRVLAWLGPKDLFHALRVSHKWHEMVILNSTLYRQPVFRAFVKRSQVESYVRTCVKYDVRRITSVNLMQDMDDSEGQCIAALVRSGLHIECLRIGSPSQDYSQLREMVAQDNDDRNNAFQSTRELNLQFDPDQTVDLGALVECMPALQDLILCVGKSPSVRQISEVRKVSFSHLKTLQFSLCEDGITTADLAAHFLQQAEFHGVDELMFTVANMAPASMLQMLRQMQPSWLELDDIRMGCRRICMLLNAARVNPETLVLRSVWEAELVYPPVNPAPFANLEVLHLGRVMRCQWSDFCRILDGAPNLRIFCLDCQRDFQVLGFDDCVDFLMDVVGFRFKDVFTRCRKLEALHVLYCCLFDDERCRELGDALHRAPKSLKKLTLTCNALSDNGIRSLFAETFSLPSLELTLERDRFATGTIHYLRKHCGKVQYTKGGRRFVV